MRQYIGARYTPKFMGAYSNTTAYESLSVVDDGMGTNYISRVPTPAGTPLTDTNYWIIYGSSNGAILDLQGRMTDAEDDITALQGRMTTAEGDIDALEDIKNNKERNIVIIGNSYTDYGCADKLAALYDHSYKFTSGGAGFFTYAGHSTTFGDLLENAIASSAFTASSITDIIFLSAMGDTRAYKEKGLTDFTSDLIQVFSDITTRISAAFPNCNNIMLTLAETRKVSYFSDDPWNCIFAVHRLFTENAIKYGIRYLGWSGFNSLFIAGDIESDNYHPTTLGASRIGQFIKDSFFGNENYVVKRAAKDYTFALCADGVIRLNFSFTPEYCTIQAERTTETANSAVTLGANSAIISDSDTTAIQLPPPLIEQQCVANLININGHSILDTLYLELRTDARGFGFFRNVNAPSISTVPTNHLAVDFLTSFTYLIGR